MNAPPDTTPSSSSEALSRTPPPHHPQSAGSARHVTGRPANACRRCKGRKTKCSYDRPKCATCVKAGVECEYPPSLADRPTWDYVHDLEARLRTFETLIHSEQQQQQQPPLPSATSPNKRRRTSGYSPHSVPHHHHHHSQHQHQPSPPTSYPHPAHASAAGSPPARAPRPAAAYSSPPPDPSPGLFLSHLAQPRGHPPSTSQLLDRLPSVADLRSITVDPIQLPPAHSPVGSRIHLPPKGTLDAWVEYFLDYINSGFPILHKPTLAETIERVKLGGQGGPSAEDVFVVLMVLAVSCTSQARGQPPSSDMKRKAREYWLQAQPYLSHALSQHGLGKLQAIHLVIFYVLHNPEAGNLWELTGGASRVCTDLGLHHETDGAGPEKRMSALEQDMRRRLFWSTYCIDRNLATALGRPPAIPDDWINAKFPSLAPDHLLSPTSPLPTTHPTDWRKLSSHHHARLRLLQSEIQSRLYTVTSSKSPPPPTSWFDAIAARIDEWRETLPPNPTGFLNEDWLNINYHISRALLFRPTPGNPNPGREALRDALVASSVIMRLYRDMWRRRSINFLWQAIHHVFMSGVTYLNSIWVASAHGWSIVPSFVEAMLDIQACSSALEAMTANEHGTTLIRDAFETVSASVIRRLSALSSNPSNTREPPTSLPHPQAHSHSHSQPTSLLAAIPHPDATLFQQQQQQQNNNTPSWQAHAQADMLGGGAGDTVDPWLSVNGNGHAAQQPDAADNLGGGAGVGFDNNPLEGFFFHPLNDLTVQGFEGFAWDVDGLFSGQQQQ